MQNINLLEPFERELYVLSRDYLLTVKHVTAWKLHNKHLNKIYSRYSPRKRILKVRQEEQNELAKNIGKILKENVPEFAIWVENLKGAGLSNIGVIIGKANPILFPRISKYWKYSGLALIDGVAQTKYTRDKYPYAKGIKEVAYLIMQRMIMQKDPFYEPIYRHYKVEVVEKAEKRAKEDKDYKMPSKGRLDKRARRLAFKVLVNHIWTVYRACRNYPVSLPYPQARMGHKWIKPPKWNDLCKKLEELGKPVILID